MYYSNYYIQRHFLLSIILHRSSAVVQTVAVNKDVIDIVNGPFEVQVLLWVYFLNVL